MDQLTELTDGMSNMKKAANALAKGNAGLSKALVKAADGSSALSDGVDGYTKAVDTLLKNMSRMSKAMENLPAAFQPIGEAYGKVQTGLVSSDAQLQKQLKSAADASNQAAAEKEKVNVLIQEQTELIEKDRKMIDELKKGASEGVSESPAKENNAGGDSEDINENAGASAQTIDHSALIELLEQDIKTKEAAIAEEKALLSALEDASKDRVDDLTAARSASADNIKNSVALGQAITSVTSGLNGAGTGADSGAAAGAGASKGDGSGSAAMNTADAASKPQVLEKGVCVFLLERVLFK